jgi:hypothetical protein
MTQWTISLAAYLYIIALEVNIRYCRIGRALVGQGLTATAAPYARSIDGHLAQHDLRTSRTGYGGSRGC